MNTVNERLRQMLKALKLNSKEVVSIIGSGGKTTLMFGLAEVLSEEKRVLVTTSTHMFLPPESKYSQVVYQSDIMAPAHYLQKLKSGPLKPKGLYLYGDQAKPCFDENQEAQVKISGFSEAFFDANYETLSAYFDVIFIEADGSRRKPFKGWRSHEPVVQNATTLTIGVFGMHHIGVEMDACYVHRPECFSAYMVKGEIRVTNETILKVITDDSGIFQKAKGRKAVYLAGATDETKTWFEEKLHGYDISIFN